MVNECNEKVKRTEMRTILKEGYIDDEEDLVLVRRKAPIVKLVHSEVCLTSAMAEYVHDKVVAIRAIFIKNNNDRT